MVKDDFEAFLCFSQEFLLKGDGFYGYTLKH